MVIRTMFGCSGHQLDHSPEGKTFKSGNSLQCSGDLMLKAVLFDLDGTLLPLDDRFVETYFSLLAKKMSDHGYDPDLLLKTIWKALAAEAANDGSVTNREMFWKVFSSVFGEDSIKDEPVFDEFYRNEFQKVKGVCSPTPKAKYIVDMLRSKGVKVILATNPIFPKVATDSRIRWAGMEPDDFDMYTTFEDIGVSKPNLDYYRLIMERMGLDPKDCLMVGNDVSEDMVAEELGMRVFLMDHYIINKDNADISRYPTGNFDDLIDHLNGLLQ